LGLLAVLCAAAFVVRAVPARTQAAEFDEAEHYIVSSQPSLSEVYITSRTQSHPPLAYLVLHYWRWLDRSIFSEVPLTG
jgi:hypothetical protein